MLTKEECKQALRYMQYHMVRDYNLCNGNILKPRFQRKVDIIKQLIEEYFYIPPIITAFKVYSDSTFQSFTKKELIEYIHTIYHNWKNACIVNERVIKMNYKLQSEIDELKSNPPLKFEELKEKMWVWDNKEKWWRNIVIVFEPCNEYPLGSLKTWANSDETSKDFIEFEENRFYRKEVDV